MEADCQIALLILPSVQISERCIRLPRINFLTHVIVFTVCHLFSGKSTTP